MNDTKRTTLRVLCTVAFVLGLMSLLAETRSTGEALESFKLILSSDAVAAVGAMVAVLAVVGFVVLSLSEHKATTKRPYRHV